MAALAAAAAATQKMATPTPQPVATLPTTPLQQTSVRVLTPQQLIQTSGGQTIKLATGASPGQQAIRLITPGQSPVGAKQLIVQKAGQPGAGQPQLMTLVKTPQGLTLAPAGAKGLPSGQVVKLVATQGGQKAGTPTIIQASQAQQLFQIANTASNVMSGGQIATTAGQKVITTVIKTSPSATPTKFSSPGVSTLASGMAQYHYYKHDDGHFVEIYDRRYN